MAYCFETWSRKWPSSCNPMDVGPTGGDPTGGGPTGGAGTAAAAAGGAMTGDAATAGAMGVTPMMAIAARTVAGLSHVFLRMRPHPFSESNVVRSTIEPTVGRLGHTVSVVSCRDVPGLANIAEGARADSRTTVEGGVDGDDEPLADWPWGSFRPTSDRVGRVIEAPLHFPRAARASRGWDAGMAPRRRATSTLGLWGGASTA